MTGSLGGEAYKYSDNHENSKDKNITHGEFTKLAVGLAALVIITNPEVGIVLFLLDTGYGMATGTSLTDRLGNGIDNIYAPIHP